MVKLAVLLLCTLCVYGAYSYKILVVFPYPGKSIVMLGHAVVRILLRAEHEITYITPYPIVETHPNLHQIKVRNDTFPDILNTRKILNKEVDISGKNVITDLLNEVSRLALENDNVQRLMNDPKQKFDLAIVQWMFNELYCSFSVVFDCPYIWVGATEIHPFILSLIDDAPNPAYMADILSNNIPPLTFFQHLQELWIQFRENIRRKYIDSQPDIYKKLIGPIVAKKGRILPPFEDVKYNASLVLSNAHYSTGQSLTLPQNLKQIGGYHIDTDIKPLQGNLKVIMDNSVNGVIYFSMGSNLKSKDMPHQMTKDLLEMFRALKETVVWKFEEDLEDVPDNVHIIKWAPQLGILAHQNCRLFITHGGLLSTTETVHFGIPIIGIPIFADQFTNVKRAVMKGFAKKVDFSYNLAHDLKLAIEEIFSDSKFTQKAKELSMIYHDRPTPPNKELVHWVEHVVRTRGAPHLRSPALLVPWYQKLYLDIILVVFVSLIIIKTMLNYLIYIQVTVNKVLLNKKIE